VAVRIVARPRGETEALGRSPQGGSLATIFADTIRDVASAMAIRQGTIVGRVMAHEVGHLLLKADGHSNHGLMRAAWGAARFADGSPEDWLFTSAEADAMKQSLAERLSRAATSHTAGNRPGN
jgi:hypothetical protein